MVACSSGGTAWTSNHMKIVVCFFNYFQLSLYFYVILYLVLVTLHKLYVHKLSFWVLHFSYITIFITTVIYSLILKHYNIFQIFWYYYYCQLQLCICNILYYAFIKLFTVTIFLIKSRFTSNSRYVWQKSYKNSCVA